MEMTRALSHRNETVPEQFDQKIARLKKLQEVSAILNSSLEQSVIRKRAIEGLTLLVGAEVASLLILDEATQELSFEVALGEKGEELRTVRLKMGEGIAGHVAKTGKPIVINNVQGDPHFASRADMRSGFVTRSMICAPVKAHDKLIGVIQAINKLDSDTFTEEDLESAISFCDQVGIAIENANLYEEEVKLLDGFIKASVVGIESRDPTTSGHSQRVAMLTCALGEALGNTSKGPYAGVTFTSDQMKELRYAALLHDFGKIGVRENVLVKANKLYPSEREVIIARFRAIKRALEAQSLKEKVERLTKRTLEVRSLKEKVKQLSSEDQDETVQLLARIDERLAEKLAETDGLLAFIMTCDRPTVLEKGGFERLEEIGSFRFQDFDGLKPYLERDEVLALSIPRGSLTHQERIEIESHTRHTYNFLSAIPWPKLLKNIPMIAYGHHEKLNGAGYPRKIKNNEIPVQTRMMTICDIFDALTAFDRPYKNAVPVPKALDILTDEVKCGFLDADLFDIFVTAKIYQQIQSP
jgi:HD-GYP domain-containing protein (c-di-GMP phosphodiesterase class II)